jgi:hypothetical protein
MAPAQGMKIAGVGNVKPNLFCITICSIMKDMFAHGYSLATPMTLTMIGKINWNVIKKRK